MMDNKVSQRPIPALDLPEYFAGGEVVAAARCPVDASTYPRRHVIVVKHAGERQTFSVHEVAHNHVAGPAGHGRPFGPPAELPGRPPLHPGTDTIDIIGWNLDASRKYRNVTGLPHVALVVDDMPVEGEPQGIEIRGLAQALAASASRDAIIRVHPRRIVSWGFARPDGTADQGGPSRQDAACGPAPGDLAGDRRFRVRA